MESHKPIILPYISIGDAGEIFVAWTELDHGKGSIWYRERIGGEWEKSKALVTGTTSDMAPVSVIDSLGVTWIAWSGTDETDDDIYYSRKIGNQWIPPERVNQNDEWPDILPSMVITESNRIVLSWLGYNGKKYVEYSCYWTGNNWSKEKITGEIPNRVNSAERLDTNLQGFISEGCQGSLLDGMTKSVRRFTKP